MAFVLCQGSWATCFGRFTTACKAQSVPKGLHTAMPPALRQLSQAHSPTCCERRYVFTLFSRKLLLSYTGKGQLRIE